MSLATAHSQPLQAELLGHNLNTGKFYADTVIYSSIKIRLDFFSMYYSFLESPRSEVAISMSTMQYSTLPSVSLNGFLFKTSSMTRVMTDRKGREGG